MIQALMAALAPSLSQSIANNPFAAAVTGMGAPEAASAFPMEQAGAIPPGGMAVPTDPLAAGMADVPTSMARTGARDMRPYRGAIRSIESAGSGGYKAIGVPHPSLGRPIGAYQVMEANIPSWSREALGFELNTEQFLNSPAAQNAVFDYKFGQYIDKFRDPALAAQAWFGGEGSVGNLTATDSLGTSIGSYADKFRTALDSGATGFDPGAGGSQSAGIVSPETQTRAQALVDKIRGKSPQERIPQINTPQEQPRGVAPVQAEPLEVAPSYDDFDISEPVERIAMSRQKLRQRSLERRAARNG